MTPTIKTVLGYGSTQIKILSDGTLRFRHELDLHSPGDFAEWTLLSEVGAPYLPRFLTLMDAFSVELGPEAEFDEHPWLADTLASVDMSHRHKAVLPDGSTQPWGAQWSAT